jgi:hypothetical protein
MNTTLGTPDLYSDVIGLSVGMGLMAAVAIVTGVAAFLYRRPSTQVDCPYCSMKLDPVTVQEHLITCETHLKTWKMKGADGDSIVYVASNEAVLKKLGSRRVL